MGEEAQLQVGKDLVTYAQASRQLAEIHLGEQDWSGVPVPVAGLTLVLEPRYKHKSLSEFRWKECYDKHGVRHAIEEGPAPKASGFTTVNSWWSSRHQLTIAVVQDKQGHAQFRVLFEDRLAFTLRTLDAASVWPVEAEQKAVEKLASLIPAERSPLKVTPASPA